MDVNSWVVITALAVLTIMAVLGWFRSLSLANQNADLRIQGVTERERAKELRKDALRSLHEVKVERARRIDAEDSLALIEDMNRVLVAANKVLLADKQERQAYLEKRRKKAPGK